MNSKVPFKTIYSNDTTNICTCVSPYHEKNAPFKPEMIRETVKEVAGKTDAHFIQLAHGRVPWYQSKVYPMKEHMKWWSEHFEVPYEDLMKMGGPNGYVRDGGDMLQDFIDACREFGQAAFVSLRINDTHHIEWVNTKGHTNGIHSISKPMAEHPEYRRGPDLSSWSERALNWIYPEVRNTLFALIEEQCENYDIDGFELDFMRHPDFFIVNETTLAQRRAIVGEFITRVRTLLNRTQRGDKYRYLCVRIPSSLKTCDNIGVDVAALEELGVDMVNISSTFFTEQAVDIKAFTEKLPNTAVYFELCHCIFTGKSLVKDKYDNFTFKRTTDEEYYSAAHIAYKEGVQGISFFNFVYYREHGTEGRGPFNEPPFHVIEECKDAELIAKKAQHFFLTKNWWSSTCQLLNAVSTEKPGNYRMKMYAPDGGWKTTTARFRIMVENELEGREFDVYFNGTKLVPCDDISEPYESDYQYIPLLPSPETTKAWTFPMELAKEGWNDIKIELTSGEPTKFYMLDLCFDN